MQLLTHTWFETVWIPSLTPARYFRSKWTHHGAYFTANIGNEKYDCVVSFETRAIILTDAKRHCLLHLTVKYIHKPVAVVDVCFKRNGFLEQIFIRANFVEIISHNNNNQLVATNWTRYLKKVSTSSNTR